MSYHVHIKNNHTKEVRKINFTYAWQGPHTIVYLTEGGLRCDCKRAKYFYESKQEAIPYGYNLCGYGQFTITKVSLDGGEEIPIEQQDTSKIK